MRHLKKIGNRSKNVWKTYLGLNSLALNILNLIIYTIINGLAEIMTGQLVIKSMSTSLYFHKPHQYQQ